MIEKQKGIGSLLLVLSMLGVVALTPIAQATWHTIMTENFERFWYQWPWSTAGRPWFVLTGSGNVGWGIQATFFAGGEQSAWCYMDRDHHNDPEYDTYHPNFYTYMRWGSFDLSEAEGALASFYILNHSEYGDSLYWAASIQADGSELGYGGSHSGILTGWETRYLDFADLRDANGDSVSLLGELQVYIYFLFKSDGDANVDMGGFIDDLIIAWDDGMVDLAAIRLTLMDPDSVPLPGLPIYGDTVIAQFRWATYGDGLLPPFYLIGTFDDMFGVDLEIDWAEGQRIYETYYPAQVMTTGEHRYEFILDPMDDIEETSEDNNQIDTTFFIDEPNFPPEFFWIRPGQNPDTTDESYLLQWDVSDAEDDAIVYIFYDTDTFDFNGQIIPGGEGISEDNGPDTLRWNVSGFQDGQELWPYARVDDPVNSIQLYARAPVVIDHGSAAPPQQGERDLNFALSQNFPNPFNEATTIQFSVSSPGYVTLRVTDLLGQECHVLLSEWLSPGIHHATVNAKGWSSGLYFYTLSNPQGSLTRKMILLK